MPAGPTARSQPSVQRKRLSAGVPLSPGGWLRLVRVLAGVHALAGLQRLIDLEEVPDL
jgi:hypothetical protein